MPEILEPPAVGLVVDGGGTIRIGVPVQDPVRFSVTAAGGAPVPHYEGETEITPDDNEHELATAGYLLSDDVIVHAVPTQTKSTSPSETAQTITPDDGLYLSQVDVGAVSSTYVGSDVPRKASADLTANGATVTAPAGYYQAAASKSVQSGSVAVPDTAITADPTLSLNSADGIVNASVNASESVTPAVSEGYVNSGAAGTMTVSGGAQLQLPTAPAQTINPTTSEQTAVAAGLYTTGAIKVAAMPVGTEGTPVATKGAVSNHSIDVTPSVSNQAGYISGGTVTGTPVSVSASDLVSGSQTVTSNQTLDVTNLASVTVAVPAPDLQSKSATYTPSTNTQTDTITADDGHDGLSAVDVTVNPMPAGSKGGSATTSVTQDASYKYYTTAWTNATSGYFAASAWNPAAQVRFQRQTETVTPSTTAQVITPTSAYYYLEKVTVNPVGAPNLQNKSKSYTPTETAQSESISADAGYDGLGTVDVSVGAISPTYVGSGVTQRSSADLSASGDTVTAPAGYYASSASTSVSGGSATPAASITGTSANVSIGTNAITLTKTISNTPQVSAGYVSAGTAGNTSVSLTGTVPTQGAQTFHPSTSDQSVSGSRYLTGAQTFKAVTTTNLSAENIKNGVTIKVGDSSDDDCVASVTGTYSGGGGSKNVQVAVGVNRVATTSYTAVSGQSLTVSKTGTYDVYWSGYRSSTGGTNGSQLFIAGNAYGTAQTTFSNNGQSVHLSGVSLTQNQAIEVRARARGTSYYMYVANLTIVEA